MSEDGGVLLTPDAFDRMAAAVRTVEGGGTIRPPQAGASGTPLGDETAIVKVTSSTADGSGNYPAVMTAFVAGAWVDGTLAVKAKAVDGETLASDGRYLASPGGTTAGGDQLWLTHQGGAVCANLFTGTQTIVTAVSCTGGSLSVTTKVMTVACGRIVSIV